MGNKLYGYKTVPKAIGQKSDMVRGKPTFVKAEKFYELLLELHFDMLDSRKRNDVMSMIYTYEDIYLLVYPYIEQYVEDIEKFEDLTEIEEILLTMRKGDSDRAQELNAQAMFNSLKLLNKKRKQLNKYIAKSGIWMLINKNRDDLAAALANDDFTMD